MKTITFLESTKCQMNNVILQQRLLEIMLTSATLALKWQHNQIWKHTRDSSILLLRDIVDMCCVPANTTIEQFKRRI